MKEPHDRRISESAVGCIIMIISGCACVGGLMFFFKVIVDILAYAQII